MGSSSWCFTLNNYEENEITFIKDNLSLLCTRLYVSKEIGEQGTPHLQGYLTLRRPKRLTGLKKLLKRAHWEKAKGDYNDNKTYVFKADSEELIKHEDLTQGKRNDITDWIETAQHSGIKRAVTQDVSTYVKYHKGLEKALAIMNAPDPRTDYPNVIWLYGPTGIGKTEYALQFKDYYICSQFPWFDGYSNQECVVFDEIDKQDKLKLVNLLQLLDKYTFHVQIKGSMVNFNPPNIVITSSVHPNVIYPDTEYEQVKRRLSKVLTRDEYTKDWIEV